MRNRDPKFSSLNMLGAFEMYPEGSCFFCLFANDLLYVSFFAFFFVFLLSVLLASSLTWYNIFLGAVEEPDP